MVSDVSFLSLQYPFSLLRTPQLKAMASDDLQSDPTKEFNNVLPNFPLLVKLLGFAHRLPPTHIAIRDNVSGIEASHINLLSDVLALRDSLNSSLDEDSRLKLETGRDVFFMVLAGPGYDYTVSFLAVLALGGVIVPVSPRVPLQEAIYFAEKSTATGIIYEPKFLTLVQPLKRHLQGNFVAVETTPSLGAYNLEPRDIYIHPSRSLSPESPGLVIFTSGTTGPPKAVVLPREIISSGAMTLAEHFELSHKDVALHCMPMNHIAGISVCFVPFLLSGARLEFEPFKVEGVWERWKQGNTTVFGGVVSKTRAPYPGVDLKSSSPPCIPG